MSEEGSSVADGIKLTLATIFEALKTVLFWSIFSLIIVIILIVIIIWKLCSKKSNSSDSSESKKKEGAEENK